MQELSERLAAHLAGGVTTLTRCWAVARRDGVVMGFTDHDRDLAFDGIVFRAASGLTASALQQSSGLSVDNAQAVGALSGAAVTEADILAGRFDRAEVRIWLVNWAEPEDRLMQFRGSLGEIRRADGAFEAELRGLAEALNQPQGAIFHKRCAAVLGDERCRFDLETPGFTETRAVEVVEDGRIFRFAEFAGFQPRWFEKGTLRVEDGPATGLVGVIKNDRIEADGRFLELWESLRADIRPGDRVRIEAGCDKREETCRLKFDNFKNFRGFPHIPGEDWLTSYPVQAGRNDGGSMNN
ncbi:hypothetical protein DDZ14_14575 [Maritimibacter sp. 55A14]|uniref:DUF2163 domain-containing protein n=1 Tax=Maritimibacter sp. 55A14 TaxID=2174844 RepID=UPI000D60ECD6|nr:DUF2163 domain-containing protein [Maritimibacter sp. 55A14]PWE30655.1 hypothetical protein DDZ14_14575 [Maritimibacter sp. 55A14]